MPTSHPQVLVFLPTEKSTEGACNQRNAVLLADFEGEMPGAALRFSRRNIFTDFRGFFFLLGDARNIDRSKGDEFPKFLPVFFFLGGMGYDLFSLYIVPFIFLSLNLAEVSRTKIEAMVVKSALRSCSSQR